MDCLNGVDQVILAFAREEVKRKRLHRLELAYNESVVSDDNGRKKIEAARLRASSADDRETARIAKSFYASLRERQTQALNQYIDARLLQLDSLVENSVLVDIDELFDSLRVVEGGPVFSPPKELTTPSVAPELSTYMAMVPKVYWPFTLIKPLKRRYEQDIELAHNKFARAYARWEEIEENRKAGLKAEREAHEQRVSSFLEKRALRDAEVEAFRKSYQNSEPEALIAFFGMVLESSEYPFDFPQEFEITYITESRQLVVDYQLPNINVVPDTLSYRYVKTRDEITSKPRKPSETRDIYSDVVAGVALRTIQEILDADGFDAIDLCCFNGYVKTIDPASGKKIKPYLVSVRTTKESFQELDLEHVDKTICLRSLGAHISRSTSEAQPVKPIIEFDMADARFVEQTGLTSRLDSGINLMDLNPFEFEELVADLFGKMGLESKLTRSSRDGGVDCVAYDKRPILGGKVVIQAKRYRHTVGVSAVRDLYGTMMNEGANKGILVTTSGFGPDAYDFQKDKPIELIEGNGLLYLLKEIGVSARIIMPEED
ncbi:restriction endonuclease [Stutzerimonas nitrititolerans]|uniref:restriction endonuclease n=1 Tax=Stutzerimonas nitrititolerans TaxID=2482751 RepID=UPI0028973291|nr:restriction endonuclease [Stutzerimonas nitrititolerans]